MRWLVLASRVLAAAEGKLTMLLCFIRSVRSVRFGSAWGEFWRGVFPDPPPVKSIYLSIYLSIYCTQCTYVRTYVRTYVLSDGQWSYFCHARVSGRDQTRSVTFGHVLATQLFFFLLPSVDNTPRAHVMLSLLFSLRLGETSRTGGRAVALDPAGQAIAVTKLFAAASACAHCR